MNILRQFTLLVLLVLGSARLAGQSWERIYPNVSPSQSSEMYKVLPTADGGFLTLIGDGTYGANAFDIHLLKIDADGHTEWTRQYNFGDLEIPQDLIATSDGGFAILYQIPGQANWFRSFLLKLDGSYNVVSRSEITQPAPVVNLRGKQLVERQQQLFVFGTAFHSNGNRNAGFVYGFDLQGTPLNDYREWSSLESEFRAATLAADGSFVVLCNARILGTTLYDLTITQLNDQNGGITWEQEFSQAGSPYLGSDLLTLPDGGFLMAGSKSSEGLLVRLDATGNTVWQQVITNNAPSPDSLQVINFDRLALNATGDGFFAAGSDPFYIPQIALASFDLQGTLIWHRLLGVKSNYNYVRDLAVLPDGGCFMAGTRSMQPSLTAFVPYAIRTNSAGQGFLSGISGKFTFDFDNDCVGDVDTITYGSTINAWQNAALISSTTVGMQGEYAMGLEPGDYLITVQKQSNAWSFCPDTIPVTVVMQDTVENVDFTTFYNPQPADSIYGYVFEDVDGDCIRDTFETVYPGWNIALILQGQGMAHTFATQSDANGYFHFTDLSGFDNTSVGSFSIAPPPGDGLNCTVTCPQAFQVKFLNGNSFEANFGVHCDSLPPCPVIDVDVATNRLRPCLPSTYNVHYCNLGAVVAENAEIVIRVDPALVVTGSSIPWSAVNGNDYTFQVGNLGPEVCNDFTFTVLTPCDDPVGTTYCVEAHAYPDTICQPAGSNWDGSQIEVNAACSGDSVVFTIHNAGTQDMGQPLEYIVTEDNVMLMQAPGQFQLNAGESVTASFPATGVFYRLEAEQTPGYPGLNAPVAWVEGCGASGGNISLGFVNQYFLPDQEPWLDIFCLESNNSYDPNDKTGFPVGLRAEHFIGQNTDIEYLIRFQNTGTAPAIDIEIRDTIPVQFLNPLTVRPGASSHAYTWDMQGNGVVTFRFPGINLPDSSESADLSQGFVKFRVAQRPDLPVGTEIRNTAAIYFDNNAPVLTNETWHTIGKDFILTETKNTVYPELQLHIAPNPMGEWVSVQIDGLKQTSDALRFQLTDGRGQAALQKQFSGNFFRFEAGRLPAGIYFYELRNGQQLLASGKLVKTK